MSAINARPTRLRHCMSRLRQLGHVRNMSLHRMVMVQGGRWRTLASRSLWTLKPALLRVLHNHIRLRRVERMTQERCEIVDKQRIQQIRDMLPVGKLQGTLIWDPSGVSEGSTNSE